MKKIKAYVNTTRIHWLVEELQRLGIEEILVREYFSPSSRISCMELLTVDDMVEKVRSVIHQLGTNGEPVDYFIHIEDFHHNPSTSQTRGQRMSPLEE